MTTGPGHDRWADAVGAYALGALPEDERAGFEVHAEACADCRAELDELRMATEALPASAVPMRPPAALKARIMAEVEREAALLAAAGPQADRPPLREPSERRSRSRWRGWFQLPTGAVAALACAALLIGLGAGALLFGSSSDGAHTVQFSMDRAQAPTAVAELDVSNDNAVLVARGLPAPSKGRVYQVWLKRPGHAPEPTAALFSPRKDGSATASVPGSLKGVEAVMVSAEPPGGSPAPTSAPILTANMT
jgi:anti-sigma-K factor RskA